MSSEREIDDYINKLEEMNEIYVDKKLEYANQCHKLEQQLGCPLDIIFKLAKQNEIYVKFYDELQHYKNIKVDVKNNLVWYCKQVGGHYACRQPFSNYGKNFWLKEDMSE